MILCLFSSTADMTELAFPVKVLTGTPEELAHRAVEWGYDGIEFMPDPDHIPNSSQVETALESSGAVMPVVNSGRMFSQGMALLHHEAGVRRRSVEAFKNILDFAGHFGARVGLGVARGQQVLGSNRRETDQIAADVFNELSAHAERVGVTIMLEPADPGSTDYINTVDEAMTWVSRVASPAFTVMLDTYELSESEPSIEHGIRAVRGQANHIHLYDPSRWPPGVIAERDRLDWQRIAQILQEEGFNGTGSVVLAPEGDIESGARKSAAYLRALFNP